MKTRHSPVFTLLIAGVLTVAHGHAAAQGDEDAIAVTRSVVKADRQAVVTQATQLTEKESQTFGRLYQQYRTEMDTVGDGLTKLLKDYTQSYPDVPEDRAKQMLKDLRSLEKRQLAIREKYLKKFGKVLPAPKNLPFAQVESRLDLALRLELAAGSRSSRLKVA